MGFMGFGMQKWIYTMRPRKPFSMERKNSFTVVPTYHRTFKIQPSKQNRSYNFAIILVAIAVLVTSFMIPKWLTHAQILNKDIEALKVSEDNKAFQFLMKSGKGRFNSGLISGAYSEFKLAYKIRPNDIELNQLLFETLEILCLDYNRSCDNYEKLKLNL